MRISALAILSALFALNLRSDILELKTGERIEGTFKQATAAGAVIEVAGQPITIPLEKVKAIYFGVASSSTAAGPPPSQEAMDALKALRSVTQSGIAYRDYAQRMLDAKVKVDRYLSSPGNDPAEFRKPIQTAMHEYELASQAWSNTINVTLAIASIGKTIMEDPETASCPTIKPLIDRLNPKKKIQDQYLEIAFRVGERPALLWTCASAQVAEAERLIAPR